MAELQNSMSSYVSLTKKQRNYYAIGGVMYKYFDFFTRSKEQNKGCCSEKQGVRVFKSS